jgi:biotin carboxylase
MANIMILGAGVYQVPLIQRVRRMGCEAHVVSRPGQYPGIVLADRFHPLDTTDIDGVVSLARNLGIVAVLTAGSDVCVPTMAAVNTALGLRGVNPDVASCLSFKGRFRAFQEAHDLPHPRFVVVRSAAECQYWVSQVAEPVILKPVDSSGSRGVARVDDGDSLSIHNTFDAALAESRCGEVCVETVIPGIEVGGNALLHSGEIIFLGITAKHMNGFLVQGHSYPTDISEGGQRSVREAIRDCCCAMGYTDGPLNFDVMVDGEDAVIIELGARLGGNGLTDLSERAFGYDVQTEMIRLALGQTPATPPADMIAPCGSYVFGSRYPGRLRHAGTEVEVRRSCPWLLELTFQRHVGDAVPAMHSNADLIGYATFDIPPDMDWEACCRRLDNALQLEVAP